MKNLADRYKNDLNRLVEVGQKIAVSIQYDCDPTSAKKTGLTKEQLPEPRNAYQMWYSEALSCVSQLLPDRKDDFIAYYKTNKPRKRIDAANYTMSDFLHGVTVYSSDTLEWSVPTGSALSCIFYQFKIVEAILRRLESTLFDIKALVHADLLDDELEAAGELNSKGFSRGAGAIAGVVLEAHLTAICEAHKQKVAKRATIATLNDLLKCADVIDVATWRFIQHLGDIRNNCDHKTKNDPSSDDVNSLIEGVRKITKTVF